MANGLFTNEELIDSLLCDLNCAVKFLIDGQTLQFCATVTGMSQKLINLKHGVKNDIENKNKVIEDLKRQLLNANINLKEMTPEEYLKEKDGAGNGTK